MSMSEPSGELKDLSDNDAEFVMHNLSRIMHLSDSMASTDQHGATAHAIYKLARDCRDAMIFDQVSRDVVRKMTVGADPIVMGYPITKDLRDFLKNGQKINAIKEFRGQSGLGLKEAKDVIEEAARVLNLSPF